MAIIYHAHPIPIPRVRVLSGHQLLQITILDLVSIIIMVDHPRLMEDRTLFRFLCKMDMVIMILKHPLLMPV